MPAWPYQAYAPWKPFLGHSARFVQVEPSNKHSAQVQVAQFAGLSLSRKPSSSMPRMPQLLQGSHVPRLSNGVSSGQAERLVQIQSDCVPGPTMLMCGGREHSSHEHSPSQVSMFVDSLHGTHTLF